MQKHIRHTGDPNFSMKIVLGPFSGAQNVTSMMSGCVLCNLSSLKMQTIQKRLKASEGGSKAD